ncbi:hypothetical protein [Flavobacterium terrisoli]|uniref:hypothetical protein n=1 Tax=Flavobacterium terrisoli TaxID=3242195 RepID=UPI002543AD64|nr:hypothetical protein [Flavobacterium buctense]
MSNTGNIPFNWNEEQDSNLFPDFSLNANANIFEGVSSTISSSSNSMFSNSPFGANWEKRLPDWALPFFGEARIIATSNLKFVDNTKTISQFKADAYNSLLAFKVKPYKYTIYIAKDNYDGEAVLGLYNDSDIKPGPNEIFIFLELDDDKLDFGKIVRVKLGENVVKDLQDKFFETDLDADDLAPEIIRQIRLLTTHKNIVEDVNNREDFEKLLIRAIEFEFNNKKFDEFSWFLFFIDGVEFLGFKTYNWVSSITDWLREKKYEEEKYWNGHLEQGYEPAFLPDFLFNKTREEKELLINKMINQPLELIDKLLEEKFGEENALSNFIKPKLLTIKKGLNESLKPHGLKMLELVDVVEGVETIIQFYNALWVGIWNGIIEFIAGFIDLIGILVLILKQEVGFRITDALWEKIEKLLNFIYYDTRDFLDLLLDKTITLFYEIYYFDFNGYKLAKNIGELIPDILTFYVSWVKASKLAKAGSVATATEEIAAKEVMQRLEKESVEEVSEQAVKEAEEDLVELFSKIIGKPIDLKLLKQLQEEFKKMGGDLIYDNDSFEYIASREKLHNETIEAITFNEELIFLNKNATTSAVYEELIHANQFRSGKYKRWVIKYNNVIAKYLMEKEAAEELLKNSKKWKLPDDEIDLIKTRLETFNNELKKLGYYD